MKIIVNEYIKGRKCQSSKFKFKIEFAALFAELKERDCVGDLNIEDTFSHALMFTEFPYSDLVKILPEKIGDKMRGEFLKTFGF
jgi:hypothetical protein